MRTTGTRPIEALIDRAAPAWPDVKAVLTNASRPVSLLPADRDQARATLLAIQVTTRSALGAIAYETGGVLVDGGWLRILGSGHPSLGGDLRTWNGLDGASPPLGLEGALIVAHDAIGGFFALNGGALTGEPGEVHYLAPDTLEWEPLGIGYTAFLGWAATGNLEEFYQGLRWPGWEAEIASLAGDQGLLITPFLWVGGPPIEERVRRPIPMAELWRLA